jgi:hypothetical protein
VECVVLNTTMEGPTCHIDAYMQWSVWS